MTIVRVNGMRVNDFNFYLKVYMENKSIDDSANINCLFTEVEVNSGGYLPSNKIQVSSTFSSVQQFNTAMNVIVFSKCMLHRNQNQFLLLGCLEVKSTFS